MARRRQRRRREKEQRHAPKPVGALKLDVGCLSEPIERLVYSREQAAQALGVSLATLDRRVIPTIATVKTEWGARLIRRASSSATSPTGASSRGPRGGDRRHPAASRHSRPR